MFFVLYNNYTLLTYYLLVHLTVTLCFVNIFSSKLRKILKLKLETKTCFQLKVQKRIFQKIFSVSHCLLRCLSDATRLPISPPLSVPLCPFCF